jgi:integrase
MNDELDVGFKVTYPDKSVDPEKPRNLNHPKKGSSIKVEPIRDLKDIKKIKDLLKDSPRDLCLFTLGINTNLRASDLVRITIRQVAHLEPGDSLNIKEKKTGKNKGITLNQTVIAAIRQLIKTIGDDSGALFQSRKNRTALQPSYINYLVKEWCKAIDLKGNYGAHTLRKTFGYIHRTRFNTDIPTLMIMFNHSSQKQTLDYLGVQPTEIKNAYMREI